jgi:hypothetical protein
MMASRRYLGMRAWAEARFGKPASEITISDIEASLPRRTDLAEPPTRDRLGGRVRFRLRSWPTNEEADDLRKRAKHFVDETRRIV